MKKYGFDPVTVKPDQGEMDVIPGQLISNVEPAGIVVPDPLENVISPLPPPTHEMGMQTSNSICAFVVIWNDTQRKKRMFFISIELTYEY